MNSLPLGLLRQKREQAGLTPEEVVDELGKRGIPINVKTLYGYGNGVSTPRVNTFIALCDIYKISDIMGEFGYTSSIKLATGVNEWHLVQLNDFFNATLLGKIFILLHDGVPSFAGYEKQLADCLPSNANAANFDRLYQIFSSLDEPAQGVAFDLMERLARQRYPKISSSDFNGFLISSSENSPKDALKTIANILNRLDANDIENLLKFAEYLSSDDKYKKSSTLPKIIDLSKYIKNPRLK